MAALILAISLMGCQGGDETEVTRAAVLEATVAEVILPTHDSLLGSASDVSTGAIEFCNSPTDAGFDELRQDLLQTRQALATAEAWGFGPARNFGIELARNVDKAPETATAIEAVIAGEEPIDVALVDSLDYTERTQGYPAIAYLLYSAGDDTLALYAQRDESAVRRCDYLVAASAHALGFIEAYHNAWDPTGADYAGQLSGAGAGSDAYGTEADAITALVSGMLTVTTEASMIWLGVPMGDDSGGTPAPEAVEAPYSDSSLALVTWRLEGIEALYSGASVSLSDYVAYREAKGAVDQSVRDGISAALVGSAAVPGPLEDAVVDAPEEVRAAIDAVDALSVVLSGELSTLLGINPTSIEGDND